MTDIVVNIFWLQNKIWINWWNSPFSKFASCHSCEQNSMVCHVLLYCLSQLVFILEY